MNKIPNWRYEDDPITKEKILDWANEWSGFEVTGGNPVPKFVLAKTQADSDVRVEFAGMCIHMQKHVNSKHRIIGTHKKTSTI